jgi:hypothetical protein
MQLCSIIYYSLAALHVSSDIFAHHQEYLNCIYSFWYYTRMSLPAGIIGDLELESPNFSMIPAGKDIQSVPLATEPGISLIIPTPMKILQRNIHTLQTHSSSFITQRMYSCSNFVAISSFVLKLLKKCQVR